MNSSFLKLNWLDLLKGLLVAVIGAIITGVYQAIETGTFAWTWAFFQPVLLGGLGAGLAYLIKNLFTNSEGEPFKKEK